MGLIVGLFFLSLFPLDKGLYERIESTEHVWTSLFSKPILPPPPHISLTHSLVVCLISHHGYVEAKS